MPRQGSRYGLQVCSDLECVRVLQELAGHIALRFRREYVVLLSFPAYYYDWLAVAKISSSPEDEETRIIRVLIGRPRPDAPSPAGSYVRADPRVSETLQSGDVDHDSVPVDPNVLHSGIERLTARAYDESVRGMDDRFVQVYQGRAVRSVVR